MSTMKVNGAKAEAAPRINAYVCRRLHITITEDRDKGVTPMFITCPQCGQPTSPHQYKERMAVSQRYQVDQSFEATHEWYRPNQSELDDLFVDMSASAFKSLVAHVQDGGLLIREKPEKKNSNSNQLAVSCDQLKKGIKELVWKLDREVWAHVPGGGQSDPWTQSKAREESRKLIEQFIAHVKK